MTIHEISKQIIDISVGGVLNGEVFTVERLCTYIQKMIRNDSDNLIMEISLPDGLWYFQIRRWTERGHFQYEYFLPETREQEMRLKKSLFKS